GCGASQEAAAQGIVDVVGHCGPPYAHGTTVWYGVLQSMACGYRAVDQGRLGVGSTRSARLSSRGAGTLRLDRVRRQGKAEWGTDGKPSTHDWRHHLGARCRSISEAGLFPWRSALIERAICFRAVRVGGSHHRRINLLWQHMDDAADTTPRQT